MRKARASEREDESSIVPAMTEISAKPPERSAVCEPTDDSSLRSFCLGILQSGDLATKLIRRHATAVLEDTERSAAYLAALDSSSTPGQAGQAR